MYPGKPARPKSPVFVDPTQGVFYATKGATTATVIDNSTETRALAISNVLTGTNTLYVSRDFNPSAAVPCAPGGANGNNCTNISKLSGPGGTLPTLTTVTDSRYTFRCLCKRRQHRFDRSDGRPGERR